MRNSRNERLSEHLLNVDEEILENAYEIDDAEKLKRYIENRKEKVKKTFYSTSVFQRAAAIAACLVLIVGVALAVPMQFSSDKVGENSGSEADKVPYIVADDNDNYRIETENIKRKNEIFISPALQEKMKAYSGTNAIYRVIVEVFIAAEDMNEFTITDEEVLSLEKQELAAWQEYYEIREELRDDLAKENDPEKRREIFNKIKDKYAIAWELDKKYNESRGILIEEYYSGIVNKRFEYASKLSKTPPVLITEESGIFVYLGYKNQAYYMDLTAEDINDLAKKGGYVFRLASSPKEVWGGIEQE